MSIVCLAVLADTTGYSSPEAAHAYRRQKARAEARMAEVDAMPADMKPLIHACPTIADALRAYQLGIRTFEAAEAYIARRSRP